MVESLARARCRRNKEPFDPLTIFVRFLMLAGGGESQIEQE